MRPAHARPRGPGESRGWALKEPGYDQVGALKRSLCWQQDTFPRTRQVRGNGGVGSGGGGREGQKRMSSRRRGNKRCWGKGTLMNQK